MSLGSDTGVVNGQRFTFPTTASYQPIAYGPQTTGVPNVSPTIPPFFGGTPSTNALGVETVGGYGTAGNNAVATSVAAANPFNLKASAVLWAVGGLLLSIVLLKGIHWRETTLGSFEESGRAGSISERAEAAA